MGDMLDQSEIRDGFLVVALILFVCATLSMLIALWVMSLSGITASAFLIAVSWVTFRLSGRTLLQKIE